MSWANLEDRGERVLGRVLQRQAEKIPDQIYIMAGEDQYSYAQVNALANSYAAGLRNLGIGRSDTVAIFMESCPEFVLTAFGANKLGGIWVPTNIDYKGEWLRQALGDSLARVLVAEDRRPPRAEPLRRLDRRQDRAEAAGGGVHVPRAVALAQRRDLGDDALAVQ